MEWINATGLSSCLEMFNPARKIPTVKTKKNIEKIVLWNIIVWSEIEKDLELTSKLPNHSVFRKSTRWWNSPIVIKSGMVYRSCIALFYRKRLPRQQGDRRRGGRETSMHLIVCGSEVGTRALPSPPTCDKRRAWGPYGCPPPNSTQTGQFSVIFEKSG